MDLRGSVEQAQLEQALQEAQKKQEEAEKAVEEALSQKTEDLLPKVLIRQLKRRCLCLLAVWSCLVLWPPCI